MTGRPRPGQDREAKPADERERPAPKQAEIPVAPRQQAILRAQRSVGNQAVVRMLSRHADHDLGPEAGGGGAPLPRLPPPPRERARRPRPRPSRRSAGCAPSTSG